MRNAQELIQHGSTDRWYPNQKRSAMNDRNGSSQKCLFENDQMKKNDPSSI